MTTAQPLFDTLPKTMPLGVLSDSGKLDPPLLRKCLGFKTADLAKAAGAPLNSVRFDHKMPAAVEQRLIEIAVICERVGAYFNGDLQKTVLWFKLPNPLLGGVSPRDMIRLGRFRKLAQFVSSALEG